MAVGALATGGFLHGDEHLAGALEDSEDRLGVAEDVAGAEEAHHAALHAEDGGLGADGRARALGVGELLAGADGAEGDVVGDDHADGGLDLLGGGLEHRAEGGRAGDRAVDDVIDLVGFEGEDLGEAAADFVEEEHAADGGRAVEARELRGGDGDTVEVVVAELTGDVPERGVVAEVGAVGVPLADGRAVGGDGFLGLDGDRGAEDGGAVVLGAERGSEGAAAVGGRAVGQGFAAEEVRGIRAEGEGGDAAEAGVGVEEFDAIEDGTIGIGEALVARAGPHEIEGVVGDAEGLVGVARERDVGVGVDERGGCGVGGVGGHGGLTKG